MGMQLTCVLGSSYIGVTHGHEVTVHRWVNSWQLMKHIHYLRFHPEAFEETVKVEIDVDLHEELIQSLERNNT
jgi:hypothetical protein